MNKQEPIQPTRQVWESWEDEQKIDWILSETKGTELVLGQPYWLLYKDTDFAIKFTWGVSKDRRQYFLRDIRLMNLDEGVRTFRQHMTALAAVKRDENKN